VVISDFSYCNERARSRKRSHCQARLLGGCRLTFLPGELEAIRDCVDFNPDFAAARRPLTAVSLTPSLSAGTVDSNSETPELQISWAPTITGRRHTLSSVAPNILSRACVDDCPLSVIVFAQFIMALGAARLWTDQGVRQYWMSICTSRLSERLDICIPLRFCLICLPLSPLSGKVSGHSYGFTVWTLCHVPHLFTSCACMCTPVKRVQVCEGLACSLC
jgi:hypothetical protein